jgi:hypothetical protein
MASAQSFSNSMEPVITEIPSVTPQKLVDDLNISTASDSSSSSWLPSNNNLILLFLIILVLLFLGFNLFGYLGEGADYLKDLLAPILKFFGYSVGETSKKTISESQKGTKFATDIVGDSIKDAVDVSEKALGIANKPSLKQDVNVNKKKRPDVATPDNSDSMLQTSKAKKKAGYCYIGEDRGFRSCVKVNKDDVCMSGEIFPSMQVCVNPSLRE